MSQKFDLATFPLEKLAAAVEKAGGQRKFCRKHGCPRATLQDYLKRAAYRERPLKDITRLEVKDGVRRFILSSAQDGTALHEPFMANLEAYANHFDRQGQQCEILIAGYTYNKSLFEDHTKRGTVWHKAIRNYMVWERLRLGDVVDFCADMNTRPTAKDPLSGFEEHTGTRWGIFPHAKVHLKSVHTMRDDPAKIIMTTGTVTKPNYVPLRAGLEAQFHHVYGAVLVEIDPDGTFFCRHLIAEQDGSFYDLDRRVDKGEVTEGHRVDGINWGDLHVAQIDPLACMTSFGILPIEREARAVRREPWRIITSDNILDTLRPKFQFFHDVSDFQARNHHNLRDPHLQFELYHTDAFSVEDEMYDTASFIQETQRPWCETVVVESNHDLALKRWLREADYRLDPPNALFFLECQTAVYRSIQQRDRSFSIFEYVMAEHFPEIELSNVRFLKTDESFVLGDIECGMHGHQGAGGAHGSAKTFAKMGRKSNTGHTHAANIWNGNYCAGTTSKLFMSYNTGLSNWSHTHIVTYSNGKRALVTLSNGKWHL